MSSDIPKGLMDHAKSRTDAVVEKLQSAMAKIELEIDSNDGIYPVNGGRLSKNEVCRRAKVSPVTLQGPAHRKTTSKTVDEWLQQIRRRMLLGAATVRKTVTERAENWETLYLAAARQTDLYRIEAIAKDQEIQAANKRIKELQTEVDDLRIQLARGKVVRMPDQR